MSSNGRHLLGILSRLRPPRSSSAPSRGLRVLVITHDYQVSITLLVAAFQQAWEISIATSLRDALKKLDRYGAAALVYDLDSREADWRALCAIAAENRADFHVITRAPDDDLFMCLVAAGGAAVWRKPLTVGEAVYAIRFGRTLAV